MSRAFSFFFLMIRRPPRSTLFPTRRSSDLDHANVAPYQRRLQHVRRVHRRAEGRPLADEVVRSEEHTSELQSRLHLVCRLLLEKKKKDQTYAIPTHTSVRCKTDTRETMLAE